MLLNALIVIAIVAALILCNALYVAGEFAAVSARKSRILQQAEAGNRAARALLPVLEDPHKLDNYIAASQVGITLSSIVLGIYGQNQITPHLASLLDRIASQVPGWLASVLAGGFAATFVLLVLTTLQVVIGELVPKSLAIQYPERVALATTYPMKWSAEILLKPLIVVLNGSGAFLLRVLGINHAGGHTHIHSPEEIEILVSESHQGGYLDADERMLLHNAFRIGELSAGEIMIPRTRMVTASINASVAEALTLAAESAYTRIPLYEEDQDHILGFVHLKDLFRLYHDDPEADLRSLVRKAPYVPETAPAIEVWNQLNTQRSYLAIVFDEYGGTAGMITQEDLIEELFGEVQDEFDQEFAPIERAGSGQLLVRGDLLVSTLNEHLNINLPTDIAHTIAGLVLDALGRAPLAQDEVEIEGVRFRVVRVDGRTINQLAVDLPEEAQRPAETEWL